MKSLPICLLLSFLSFLTLFSLCVGDKPEDVDFPFERRCGGGAPQITCSKWAASHKCKKPVCRPGKEKLRHYCYCEESESDSCFADADCSKINNNCQCKDKKCVNCKTPAKSTETWYDDYYPKSRYCGSENPNDPPKNLDVKCYQWGKDSHCLTLAKCRPRPSDNREFCFCDKYADNTVKCTKGNNAECLKVGLCQCDAFKGTVGCINCQLPDKKGTFPEARQCKADADCGNWKGKKCKEAVCLDGPEGKEKKKYCYCVGATDYTCAQSNDCWAVGMCRCKTEAGKSTCGDCVA